MRIVDNRGQVVSKAEVGQTLYAEIAIKNQSQRFSFAVDGPGGKSNR